MRIINLFYVGFYLGITVMIMFNIVDMTKTSQVIMALSLALFFVKEVLEVAE